MGTEPFDRKLAAILYADVAGYSRLTGEDEDATHRTLSEYLDFIAKTIAKHRGQVMHYAGDAVLAKFDAVVDALSAAVTIQKELKGRNQDLPHEQKVQFRIGVNLGDVIEDRSDIYGDGVNVAARLEGVAEPGGICISESVHTTVGQKLALEYEPLGEQQVKNIAKPVRTYRVVLDAAEQGSANEEVSRGRKVSQRLTVAATVVVLVALAGWLASPGPWAPSLERSPGEVVTTTLPDKPSIAVLPFSNLSADPEQEYFAEGMSEDLITDLSKLSGLFVIARNSTFTYKGRSVDVRQVADELGVRYVLEGSVRRAGDQVRINAQLVDANTGGHLWAERYDGELTDVFALQDKVTSQVIDALAIVLTPAEEAQRATSETPSSDAYDAFLKGWAHYLQRTPDHYVKARGYFERAIEIDPNYSRAYAALASVYWKAYFERWYPALEMDRYTARDRARKYLDSAGTNPTSLAHQVASYMNLWRGRWDEAVVEGQRAVDRDPNDADSHVTLAEMYIYAGNPHPALHLITKAQRLDPHNQGYHAFLSGLAQFGMEQFDAAVASLERALELNPELWLLRDEFGPQRCAPCRPLAAAYAYLGRKQEAQAVAYRDVDLPTFTVRNEMAYWPFQHDADRDRLARGLIEAGVPESALDIK
jgi:adenylate cyclase